MISIIKKYVYFRTIIAYLICLTLIQTCSIYKKESKIELENNGYSNILIAIDDDVKENHELIERIKQTFTSSSHFLFQVTK